MITMPRHKNTQSTDDSMACKVKLMELEWEHEQLLEEEKRVDWSWSLG
jgi:hypothetical protein